MSLAYAWCGWWLPGYREGDGPRGWDAVYNIKRQIKTAGTIKGRPTKLRDLLRTYPIDTASSASLASDTGCVLVHVRVVADAAVEIVVTVDVGVAGAD